MKKHVKVILVLAISVVMTAAFGVSSTPTANAEAGRANNPKPLTVGQPVKGRSQLKTASCSARGVAGDVSCEKVVLLETRPAGAGVNIITMNLEGTGRAGLLPDGVSGFHPKLSPDGTKVLFSQRRDTADDLFLINTDGTGIFQLTNAAADNGETAVFSGDGTKVFFDRFTDSNGDWDYSVFAINIDGTGLSPLTPVDGNYKFLKSLSPDGSKILYSKEIDLPGELNDPYDLFSMNTDGTGSFRLTTSTEFQDISNAEFSADGSLVLFGSRDTDDNFIETVNADGTGRVRLSPPGYFSIHSSFSPDGTKILYSSDGGSGNFTQDLYTMNADGSGALNLTASAADESEPVFNPARHFTSLGR